MTTAPANALLQANGTVLPVPSSYTTITQEINSARTSRNVSGTMIKYRIATKKTISVKWAVLTRDQKNAIVSATSGSTFSVVYFDVESDTWMEGTFYRGSDYSVSPLVNANLTDNVVSSFKYYTVSMSLIEV